MKPHFLIELVDALNKKGKAVKDSRIMVLGVAYKVNVADTRESPALDIIHMLSSKGAKVIYNDPFVPTLLVGGLERRSVELSPRLLAETDSVVIVTPHSAYDWVDIVAASDLVLDTRNATKDAKTGPGKIIKLQETVSSRGYILITSHVAIDREKSTRLLRALIAAGTDFISSYPGKALVAYGRDVMIINSFSTVRFENIEDSVNSHRFAFTTETISKEMLISRLASV